MSVLPDEFSERLARVVKLLKTQRTLPTQLESAVALAKRTVPNCDAAGVNLVIVGDPVTAAASDRVVVEVDLVQYQTGQGPCLDAMARSNVVRVDLIEKEIRYSRFVPGAADTGINSMISFPLFAAGRTVGAFNLYSYSSDAFDHETEATMEPIVGFAADAVASSPLYAYSLDMVDGLLESVETQAIISQAAGVLMARHELTSTQAFDLLRERALLRGSSLREAADFAIAGGGAG